MRRPERTRHKSEPRDRGGRARPRNAVFRVGSLTAEATPLNARPPLSFLKNDSHQQLVCDLELQLSRLKANFNAMEERTRLLDYYQEMFHSAPVGFALLDEAGLIRDVNTQLRAMLGPGLGADIGGPFVRFVVKGKVADFLQHLHQVKSNSGPVSTDLLLRARDGSVLPVEFISMPIDAARGMKLFRTIVVDISHRSALKQALAKTQYDLHALVDTSQGMFWEADANTQNVVYMSRSARNILGYPVKDWCASSFWREHIHAEDRERVTTELGRLARTNSSRRAANGPVYSSAMSAGQPLHNPWPLEDSHAQLAERPESWGPRAVLEFRMIASDRRIVWLHCTFALREIDGKKRLYGYGVDFTERKLQEEALQQGYLELEKRIEDRTAELRETVSQLETFSYSLSHDMRAPLRTMNGFCEMLLDRLAPKLGDYERDLFQRVLNGACRLDRLIQDVLHYSEVSRVQIELKPVDLEKLLENTLRDYPSLKVAEADISVEKPLLQVLGHEAFLTQCFSNLLSNALKFVEPGQKPRVRVRTEPVDSQVRVWIEDNGVGIDSESQKRVFSIFQRVHKAPNLYEGTGLGLAIVSKAVERMGGRVGVEAQPRQGSRFWFQLKGAHA